MNNIKFDKKTLDEIFQRIALGNSIKSVLDDKGLSYEGFRKTIRKSDKLKKLFDEIEELNAQTEKDIKASDELIGRIDNEMDRLDEIIYGDENITDVTASTTNDLVIKILPASTLTKIYGAKVTIASV